MMDPVALGIFIVCGLLVGGAIALRRPKAKVPASPADKPPPADADIDLKIPENPDVDANDRDLN
jgi:hypothetical protein